MTTLARMMSPLRRAAQAFFQSDVKLRREDGGVRLVLADRMADPVVRVPTAAERLAEKQKQELQLMLSQLAEVLGEMPDTRETLRHLVFVDEVHRFNKSQQDAFLPYVEDGTVCFIGATTENPSFEINSALLSRARVYVLRSLTADDLQQVLRRALDQFEGLVTNWSPEGLANLRSKMAVTVIDRETDPGMTEPGGLDSMFSPSQLEAVLDPPRIAAERAIEAARESAFADSTIERLALEFGVTREPAASHTVELQAELHSPSAKALGRGQNDRRAGQVGEIELRDLQT